MKRILALAALVIFAAMCSSAASITLGTFAVNPQMTFLWESSNDVNVGALFISLNCPVGTPNCVTAPAGTVLQIIGIGQACYGNSPCPPEAGATLGGVFDSNNTLNNSATGQNPNVNRLTGTINANASRNLVDHNAFLNTWYGNVDTTIQNDFFIPVGNGIQVVVPTGAAYLVIGVLDSYFADNSDPSHTLAVQINQITAPGVPEPGTVGFILAGLGLIAFRRYRSR